MSTFTQKRDYLLKQCPENDPSVEEMLNNLTPEQEYVLDDLLEGLSVIDQYNDRYRLRSSVKRKHETYQINCNACEYKEIMETTRMNHVDATWFKFTCPSCQKDQICSRNNKDALTSELLLR